MVIYFHVVLMIVHSGWMVTSQNHVVGKAAGINNLIPYRGRQCHHKCVVSILFSPSFQLLSLYVAGTLGFKMREIYMTVIVKTDFSAFFS